MRNFTQAFQQARIGFLACFFTLISAFAVAAETLHIEGGWIRQTPPNANVSAGYMIIQNKSGQADRLISVQADFAKKSEIHDMVMDGGVMKMRPFENGLEVRANSTAVLKPKSAHLMFMGLKQPMKKGDSHLITLQFEKAGTIKIELPVLGQMPEVKAHSHNH